MSKINEVRDQDNKDQVDSKPFMTVDEACAYLGVSKSTMYKYLHKREFPVFKPNNKLVYIDPADLNNWVFRNKIDSAEDLRKRVNQSLAERSI